MDVRSYPAASLLLGGGRARRRQMTEAAGSRRARWRAGGRRGDGAHVPSHRCCWMARGRSPSPLVACLLLVAAEGVN
ncbi:hypothetical protein ACP4OV_025560 [Aristida adscensionis]